MCATSHSSASENSWKKASVRSVSKRSESANLCALRATLRPGRNTCASSRENAAQSWKRSPRSRAIACITTASISGASAGRSREGGAAGAWVIW